MGDEIDVSPPSALRNTLPRPSTLSATSRAFSRSKRARTGSHWVR